MCVILIGDDKRPTENMVARAFHRNAEGGGIAWLEPAQDGNGTEVVWKKDLGLEEIQDLVAKVPMPFIAHFRIASIGGIRPELTHPFEIGPEADNAIEGRTKLAVLFHNGTWGKWDDMVLTSAVKFSIPIPRRKWNDSRGLAFLGWLYGRGLYELLPEQKIAVLSPEGVEIYGNHWKSVDGILASNDAWVNEYIHGFPHSQTGHQQINGGTESSLNDRKPCAFGNCRNSSVWGRIYCTEHAAVGATEIEGKMIYLTPKGDTQASANERSPFEMRCHRVVKKNPDLVFAVAQRVFESRDGRLSKNGWKRVQHEVENERFRIQSLEKAKEPLLLPN